MELILSVVSGKPGVVGAFVGPGTIYCSDYKLMQVFQHISHCFVKSLLIKLKKDKVKKSVTRKC